MSTERKGRIWDAIFGRSPPPEVQRLNEAMLATANEIVEAAQELQTNVVEGHSLATDIVRARINRLLDQLARHELALDSLEDSLALEGDRDAEYADRRPMVAKGAHAAYNGR